MLSRWNALIAEIVGTFLFFFVAWAHRAAAAGRW